MEREDYCQGCLANHEICIADPNRKDGMECPCGICLIKGICRVMCLDYALFRGYDFPEGKYNGS